MLHILILQRLQAKIIKVVDVSYGGENGFNQAIELAADALDNVKFIQEKKLIGKTLNHLLLSLYSPVAAN
jgi:peptide chain release factor subunit 1